MLRSLPRLATSQSLLRHLNERSIPHHSNEDIVAILSNTIESKFSPMVADLVSKRLRGMLPIHIFQIITGIHRYKSRHILPQTFLNELLGEIIDGDNSLDFHASIRAIEMIAELSGPRFDPFLIPHFLSDPGAPLSSLLRLCCLGGFSNLTDTLKTRIAGAQSEYDLARIVFLTGDKSALERIPSINCPDSLPYILQGAAAWDLCIPDYIPEEVIRKISPRNAQVALWSGLIAGLDAPVRNRLEAIANREQWESHAMHEQYKMRTISDYSPKYPIRIPQLGTERKQLAVENIRSLMINEGIKVSRKTDADHAFDLCLDDAIYLDVVTYPGHPQYLIHKKYVSSNLPVIEIPVNSANNFQSIYELVSPYL